MWRKSKAGIIVGTVLVAAWIMAVAPLAAAVTYTLAPPYVYGPTQDNEWRTEMTGTPIQWNADYTQCVGVYTPVWAQGSSGTGGLHYEVQAILLYEECGDDAWVIFFGNQFTPSVSGYYTVTATWTLSPVPGLGYFEVQGAALPGQFSANLIIHANLFDTYSGNSLTPWSGTVLSKTVSDEPMTWEYWSTQTYSASTTGAYLVAGHTYQMYNSFEAKIVADGGGIPPGAYIGDVLSIANPSFTAYIYTSSGGGGGCIASGTPILLPNGRNTVPIDKLHEGDQVMGYNLTTGKLVPVTVVSNTYSYVPQAMDINNGTLVVTTTDQPLYARNATWQGWLRNPEELRAGWQLFNPVTDRWINVTSVEMKDGNFKVYDLSVSPVNDFIADGILADMKA